jgi:hypothetical protein
MPGSDPGIDDIEVIQPARPRERAYRIGRCDHWVKVKNRKHPAYSRVADQF